MAPGRVGTLMAHKVMYHGTARTVDGRAKREGLHTGLGDWYDRGVDLSPSREIAEHYALYTALVEGAKAVIAEASAHAREGGDYWNASRIDELNRLAVNSEGVVYTIEAEEDTRLGLPCKQCGGYCPSLPRVKPAAIVATDVVGFKSLEQAWEIRRRVEAFIAAYERKATRPKTEKQALVLWDHLSKGAVT